MNSPFIRIEWNKYETALLINAYESVVASDVSRKNAVSMLSERLRNRMLLHGIQVSNKYRNINGINMQMAVMEFYLTNGQKGMNHPCRLFSEISHMALENREAYDQLLNEALVMYPEPVKIQEATIATDYSSLQNSSCNIVREDNIKYRQSLTRIKDVLYQRFPRGFRLRSAIETKRFRRFYADIFGCEYENRDDVLVENIAACGIESNNKIFIPEQLLSNDIKGEITSFVEQTFASNIHYVFYEVLFKNFSDQLLDSQIVDEAMLRAYLQYYFDGKWRFFSKYLADVDEIKINVDQKVIGYVIEQGKAVFEDEVIEGIPSLPQDWVRHSFNTNASILISNGRNQRFHIEMFVASPEELNSISYIINTTINQYSFIGADELISDIRQKVPSLMTNNSALSDLGIRNALACKLGNEFSFNNAVISAHNQKLTSLDAIMAFCKTHDEFSLVEISQLADTLGTILNYHLKNILKYAIRISYDTFISRKKISFDVEKIDDAIEKYCISDYLPITSINNFTVFPDCGHIWNEWLLESYLLTNSQRFTLLHGDYLNKNNVSGAIAKCSSSYKTFDDVLIHALASSNIELSKDFALNYLASEGYIVQRRLSGIDVLLIKVHEFRNKTNNN